MKKTIIIILLLIPFVFVNAQETFVDCGNPVLKEYSKKYKLEMQTKNVQEVDTIELPFFDDFANSKMYPDQTKWLDLNAFIHNDYAINPISINVASLDAIDETGAVYPHLPSLSSGTADFMTSAPIDLDVLAEDSVYLSFYYQAGGNGNVPEERDSLVLQFKDIDDNWLSVWNVEGGEAMDTFNVVMIPITDDEYLVKGFQFRFLNYASISSNYEPSWVSNTDVWNIDYVKLDTARTWDDTLANDVAFIKDFGSKLYGFESVPWNHFKERIGEDLVKDTLTFTYRSSFGLDTKNINRQVEIIDMYGTEPTFSMLDDSENILPLEIIDYSRPIVCDFNSNSEDSAKFLIKGYLKTDLTEERYRYRWNDTIEYYQNFNNYYAYDDGTAEKGYGISGQGTAFSSLCVQFTPLKADSLKGVYIYFNQVLNEANTDYFFLTVWDDDNGQPGDTLCQRIGAKPHYSDATNKFLYYSLDTTIYVDTTFYIGWIKTTDDMLNCGYDLNNDSGSHIFYNVGGTWETHSYNGSMMVRPVFEYVFDNSASVPEITKKIDFDIYPNPAGEYINISSYDNYSSANIYDAVGRLIISTDNSEQIFIGDLQEGTYFIRLESEFNVFKTKKLLILR